MVVVDDVFFFFEMVKFKKSSELFEESLSAKETIIIESRVVFFVPSFLEEQKTK